MDKLRTIASWAAARLEERNTWTGIGAILGGIGVSVAPDAWAHIVDAAVGVFALIAFLVPEKK